MLGSWMRENKSKIEFRSTYCYAMDKESKNVTIVLVIVIVDVVVVKQLIGNAIQNGGNANNNCCRPGTGTTGLEADEEQTQSSSQATQPLIKIGVSTRGRGSGRVRGSRGFGSRK